MNNALLILPTTLISTKIIFSKIISKFNNNEDVLYNSIIIYEHPVNFTYYNYHKLKLILHRSSMKYYQSVLVDYIKNNGINIKVKYINYNDKLILHEYDCVYLFDPCDHMVIDNLSKNKNIIYLNNPMYILSNEDLDEYDSSLSGKTKKRTMSIFYKWARLKYNILMAKGKPLYGKWSFDVDNRLPYPKEFTNNDVDKLSKNITTIEQNFITKATKYINKHFKENPPYVSTKFSSIMNDLYLPISHIGAKRQFNQFVKNRLDNFGSYEDGMKTDVIYGYHSVLSPLMNIGLILPSSIIKFIHKLIDKKGKSIHTIYSSIEGYIRQLFWREYCRYIYIKKLIKQKELIKHKSANLWNNKNKLSNLWYYNNINNNINNDNNINHDINLQQHKSDIIYNKKTITGFNFIDDLIYKTMRYGYLHHIERLMFMGNYMLLTRIKPVDVFNWFQCMFLDSYHVFMYTNVFCMSQYSFGSIMTNRPYFSSSNYILKMSNINKSDDIYFSDDKIYKWPIIWDALYYMFIYKNKNILIKNYATAQFVYHWNKKSKKDKLTIIKLAKYYLSNKIY